MLRIACWLPLLLLTACLEFEQQELHLRYDAEADRMDVLFVYRGLYAAESNPMPVRDGRSPIDKALSDLEKVREHGAFAFKSPMNFRVDPVEEAEKDWVSKHIDVEYGGLFTDPKGRLCGYQFVRIRDFGAFVPRFAKEHQELLFSLFGAAVDKENGWCRFIIDLRDQSHAYRGRATGAGSSINRYSSSCGDELERSSTGPSRGWVKVSRTTSLCACSSSRARLASGALVKNI